VIFYPDDISYPDANHIELASVIFPTPCVDIIVTWYYNLMVGFSSEAGQPYLGKNIGVKIGFPNIAEDWSLMDNVRLDVVDSGVAWRPSPTDGATGVLQPVTLIWSPGDLVQSTAGHEVYLGTDYNDVNDANTSSTGIYRSAEDVNNYSPGALVWQQRYYWRVDEVNGVDRSKGDVWNFTVVAAKASEPSPANNAEDVSPLAVLSWVAGLEAVTHEVYFSTDYNDVNERLISPEILSANSYDPCGLAMAQQYYWRVDEVNLDSSTPRWYGDVWRFETEWYRVVDDMESYGLGVNVIYDTWLEVSPTHASINLETNPPYVHDGDSMQFDYDNAGKSAPQNKWRGSWTEADACSLPIASSDLTVGGAKSLQLFFYGDPGNSATVNDKMYVALDDGTNPIGVSIYPDINDINKAEWQEWNILLEDFNSQNVDLTSISKVHIGFGHQDRTGQSADGGTGRVYFDDIRVYPSRCRSELVAADFNWNCVTDIWDLWLIAHRWLQTEGEVAAVPAPTSNTEGLVVRYEFEETSGTTAYDSSGNGYDGVVNTTIAWDPGAGYDSNGCLDFAGGVDVEIPNDAWTFPMEAITVSMWLKPNPLPLPIIPQDIACPFGAGDDDDYWLLVMMYLSIDWDTSEQLPGHEIEFRSSAWDEIKYHDPNTNGWVGWHHYAFVKDSGNSLQSIYRDGELIAQNWWDATDLIQPIDPNNDTFALGYSGSTEWGWGVYNGWMDDFRVYDHALPQSQIVDLAGKSLVDQAFLSDDDKIDANEDHVLNFGDYAIMADNWLKEPTLWP